MILASLKVPLLSVQVVFLDLGFSVRSSRSEDKKDEEWRLKSLFRRRKSSKV